VRNAQGRLALVAAAVALGGVLAATGVADSGEENLAHGPHKVPGNVAVAYPLADGVRRVGGDNTSTGGHVVIEGNRLYVGAYASGCASSTSPTATVHG
jgi:hypothetical protein